MAKTILQVQNSLESPLPHEAEPASFETDTQKGEAVFAGGECQRHYVGRTKKTRHSRLWETSQSPRGWGSSQTKLVLASGGTEKGEEAAGGVRWDRGRTRRGPTAAGLLLFTH